ncbi:type IV secretion system protein [Asticcacaulis sp. ZE23SCel15]|uniref:type IV secretion system protein n=1 Tax=Asticcacaulis sp. ZE23SCel15 TaxID=3059027 RepID=UPI00265F2569|nr:type IV secretion system protein [Asticcacaulis sp. ZE23SCel15]WKL58310.1 type IV secretion system protein [Asticcacaulis sp. ZE23SCel15]
MTPVISACPSMPLEGSTGISGALISVDCQISQVVESSFARLFGSGGMLGSVLTALLTLYIAFLAYGLITGRTRMTLTTMSPRVLAIGLVLTFVTAWPAYQTVVYNLLTRGPDEIAAALTGSPGGATIAFSRRLDVLFVHFADAATALENSTAQTAQTTTSLMRNGKTTASDLLWGSGLILLLSTVGTLILSRLILTLLLATGPIFVIFALFSSTRGLFEGWLRTAVGFAFVPMLVVLGGSACLTLLSPVILAISNDPLKALNDIQPIVILFMGSIIYATLLLLLMWTAFNMLKGWHPLKGRTEPQTPENVQVAQTLAAGQSAALQTQGLINRMGAAGSNTATSVSNSSRLQSVSTSLSTVQSAAGSSASSSSGARRANTVQGLGQRFRANAPSNATAPLSKTPGS